MRVVDLKALMKERGLRGYSRLKKAELIAFIQEPHARPPLREPIDDRLRPPSIPAPASCTRPPPPPPPELRPYQLKPKRGKETFIEPPMEQPTSNLKQIRCMKKKLGKLDKKIKHSKKKHNNLISK